MDVNVLKFDCIKIYIMKKTFITLSVSLLILVVTGCKTGKEGISKENLSSTAWQLSSMSGKSVIAANYPNGLPDVTFAADNKINGHGGCNRYGGSYTLDADGKLTLSQMISTKMFCEGVAEDVYMKILSKANQIKIKGNNLVLYNNDKEILSFVPKKSE